MPGSVLSTTWGLTQASSPPLFWVPSIFCIQAEDQERKEAKGHTGML